MVLQDLGPEEHNYYELVRVLKKRYEDFRTVLPLLDLVKSKFPSDIRQKLISNIKQEIDAVEAENVVVATTTDIVTLDGTLREVHPTTTVDDVNDRTVPDHKLKLELISKEVVTLAQRPPRLHQEDVDFIRHHGFDLPLRREDTIVLDILIGIDHYWDIICPEAPICLPTGMVLCHRPMLYFGDASATLCYAGCYALRGSSPNTVADNSVAGV
ncbi:unnamed protein product [Heligmosomoides polygyrus]|uniref:DUF1758 domain-containing protein n=1 Tax=Heligmosomoides polygyrus TaxID=6339 RepID=A0A183G1I6_HELPZ|nr:unnamed protein product [Heligmosomoides polygyrus]